MEIKVRTATRKLNLEHQKWISIFNTVMSQIDFNVSENRKIIDQLAAAIDELGDEIESREEKEKTKC